MKKMIIVSGKRKSAVARAVLKEGSGKVTFNKNPNEIWNIFDRIKMKEP